MLVGMDPSKRDQYAREKNLRAAFLAEEILDIAARKRRAWLSGFRTAA